RKRSGTIKGGGKRRELTGRKGPGGPERRCIAVAATPLPVPLSPWSSTDTVEAAIASSCLSSAASEGTRVTSTGEADRISLLFKSAGSSGEVANASRNKKKLWPSSIRSPSVSSVLFSIRPLIRVPFFDFVSSMTQD